MDGLLAKSFFCYLKRTLIQQFKAYFKHKVTTSAMLSSKVQRFAFSYPNTICQSKTAWFKKPALFSSNFFFTRSQSFSVNLKTITMRGCRRPGTNGAARLADFLISCKLLYFSTQFVTNSKQPTAVDQ